MAPLQLLQAIPPVALYVALALPALALVVVVLLLPRGASLVLPSWPALLWLYTQALMSLSKSKSAKGAPAGKAIQVALSRPLHFSAPRLRGYLHLAGFEAGTAGAVPLLYPAVETFRLAMQAMLLPAFPFNVLGSVLARTRVVALRRVGADEQLVFSCRVDPAFRTTPKGDTEVDLVLEAHAPTTTAGTGASAGGAAGGSSLVWRCVVVCIILSPRRGKPGSSSSSAGGAPAPAPAGSAAAAPAALSCADAAVVDTWQLGGDTGRRYGLLNGDLNPIHLYPLTSQLFGFKRPIAHALYLTGRAEAALSNAGLKLSYPCVLSADFKRPTLLPAVLHCGWAPSAAADPRVALQSAEGVRFCVMVEDKSKEVLVGSISCDAGVVKAALAAA